MISFVFGVTNFSLNHSYSTFQTCAINLEASTPKGRESTNTPSPKTTSYALSDLSRYRWLHVTARAPEKAFQVLTYFQSLSFTN